MDKQNLHSASSPLRQKHYNMKAAFPRQDFKHHKHDHILMAIQDEINSNSSCDLLEVILTDPLLKELNTSLQKQAELQKKNKLLQSFPLRYRNLVHTEALYRKLQENLKVVEKETQEVKVMQQTQKEELLSQIRYFKDAAESKDREILSLKNDFQIEKTAIVEQFQTMIEAKDKEISIKIEEINEIERKVIKVKCQKQNLIQYLEELKEEAQNLKKQNERIIQLVTAHELEINRLNVVLTQNQDLYKSNNQKFIQEHTIIQLECKQKIDLKSNECNHLIIQNQNIKEKLKQCHAQISILLNAKQKQQRQHSQLIQQIQTEFTESIKQKNSLQASMLQLSEENNAKISNLSQRVAQLSSQLINKNIEMQEKNLNNQLEIHKVRDMMKKIVESKDETIEQIRQNVNLITEEKLFTQTKLLKLQTQKQELFHQIEKLKYELEMQEKKILEINIQSKRTESKNIEIEKIRTQFQDQLSKFMEIIKEKQQKIQQYRKNIMNLRSKINEVISQKQSMVEELQIYVNNNSILINEVDRLRTELGRCNTKESALSEQIQGYSKIINKKKQQKQTQFEILEGINDSQQIKLEQLQKLVEKTQRKYENILEELQQYKKQYKQDMAEKQIIINSLKTDNKNMKEMIGNKMGENVDISKLLNSKIEELKSFYEHKMIEQDKKYRTTIDVLKKEVIELYKQIDLKKSMEEEMFNEIMKINKERKTNRQEIQL